MLIGPHLPHPRHRSWEGTGTSTAQFHSRPARHTIPKWPRARPSPRQSGKGLQLSDSSRVFSCWPDTQIPIAEGRDPPPSKRDETPVPVILKG